MAAAPIPSCYGDQNTAPDISNVRNGVGESWDLWRTLQLGPSMASTATDNFCSDFEATNWMSATIQDKRRRDHQEDYWRLQERSKRRKSHWRRIATVKDSTDNWYLSWTINRQPQFRALRDKDTVLIWVYALALTSLVILLRKPCVTALVRKFARSVIYHIGVPTKKIGDWAKEPLHTTTCFMPINAFSSQAEDILGCPWGSCWPLGLLLTACWDSSWHYLYYRITS